MSSSHLIDFSGFDGDSERTNAFITFILKVLNGLNRKTTICRKIDFKATSYKGSILRMTKIWLPKCFITGTRLFKSYQQIGPQKSRRFPKRKNTVGCIYTSRAHSAHSLVLRIAVSKSILGAKPSCFFALRLEKTHLPAYTCSSPSGRSMVALLILSID